MANAPRRNPWSWLVVAVGAAVAGPVHNAGAASLGQVERGRLVDGRALPSRGPHHYILPRRHRVRGLRYATPELIELLEEAAASVATRHPGPRLGVGNLSRRRGGRIRFSRSHQSGRDADLAFYVTDARGRTVEPRDFVKINARGRGRRDLRFDVERNWALVEALLSSERARIQWLLISRPLRRRLLAYAKATRVPAAILGRARRVLHQPRWALPHDDHLHVRIYCSPHDVARGCRDTGPRWPWISSEPAMKVTTQTPAR